MLDFKEIKLEDRATFERYFSMKRCRLSDYCFGSIYIWRKPLKTVFAEKDGFLFIKIGDGNSTRYMMPIGSGDVSYAVRLVMQDAKERGTPFMLASVDEQTAKKLAIDFDGVLRCKNDRDLADYLYNASDVINLSGKKYHSKRNHITKFVSTYRDWTYEGITDKNIGDCREMLKDWCEQKNCEDNQQLADEMAALDECFDNFETLNMKGGLIRVDGKVAAFSIGEPMFGGSDTFVIHFEKALTEYDGAYAVINQQFAAAECADFAYINREEDMGQEGLRKAKLSYHPAMLLDKYEFYLVNR